MRCCSCNRPFHASLIKLPDGKLTFEKVCNRCILATYDILDTEPKMGDVLTDLFENGSKTGIDNY